MVTINNAKITKADVSTAATDAGMSKTQLQGLAAQLTALAGEMKLGDGTALKELASVLGEAASSLGQSTQQGGGFDPSPASTSRPGM